MARAGDVAVQDVRIQQTWTTIGNLSLRDPGTRRHTPAIVSSIQSTSPVPSPIPAALRMFQLYCTNLQSNASAYIVHNYIMLARYRRINVASSWGGEEARDEMDALIITFGYAVFAMGRVDSSHMHHKLTTAARDNTAWPRSFSTPAPWPPAARVCGPRPSRTFRTTRSTTVNTSVRPMMHPLI